MLDQQSLFREAAVIVIIGLIAAAIGSPTIGAIFTAAAALLFSLGLCVKPFQPPVIAPDVIRAISRDFMLPAGDAEAFVKYYSSDPNFTQAMLYLHGLSPTEYMRVVRMCNELRQSMDSAALRTIAQTVRKGNIKV